jgi:hypothetical protein
MLHYGTLDTTVGPMAFAKFLVCEDLNRWTVALRWGLGQDHAQLVVSQDLDDCWQDLDLAPASFLAVELNESNLESIVDRLQDVRNRFPLARAAVMCDRSLASCEWLLREAGAVHVAVSTRDISTVIRLAERHFAQVRQPVVGMRQSVWDRLPWQEPSIKRT